MLIINPGHIADALISHASHAWHHGIIYALSVSFHEPTMIHTGLQASYTRAAANTSFPLAFQLADRRHASHSPLTKAATLTAESCCGVERLRSAPHAGRARVHAAQTAAPSLCCMRCVTQCMLHAASSAVGDTWAAPAAERRLSRCTAHTQHKRAAPDAASEAALQTEGEQMVSGQRCVPALCRREFSGTREADASEKHAASTLYSALQQRSWSEKQQHRCPKL
jgi:hypothetical protein